MKNNNIKKIDLSIQMKNSYMGYAISTVVNRALPDVRDGMLPVHRRILHAFREDGITQKCNPMPKSSKGVSSAMARHAHGDGSIYGTIANMTDKSEVFLHPFLQGNGSFGKVYSTDKPSQMRYTFCRLNDFSEEMFKDIDKNIIKMVGDKDHPSPVVLPNTFPNILVQPTKAIAVGEACSFGSFNLKDVCEYTIKYIYDKTLNPSDYLIPDFSTGGYLIYNKNDIENVCNNGNGSIILRAKYRYIEEENCIEIYEIPYSTTANKIISEIGNKLKLDKFKEIVDVRDETGFNKNTKKEELKITIDVKKNTNVKLLMKNLFCETSLEKPFSFNMNCLVNYSPKVLGINSILDEWILFRKECVKKGLIFDLNNLEKELHKLESIVKTLVDPDKTIKIIRFSKKGEIINNLIKEYEIDEDIAKKIKTMPLENVNDEQREELKFKLSQLKNKKNELNNQINNEDEINKIIVSQLENVIKKYSKPRKTEILYNDEFSNIESTNIDPYNCSIAITNDGYIKKTQKHSDNHKLKENDFVIEEFKCNNRDTLFLFTNTGFRIKLPVNDISLLQQPSKSLGEYIPTLLSNTLLKDEKIIKVIAVPQDAKGFMINTYDSGKISKVNISAYISNYTRLTNSYDITSQLLDIKYVDKDVDVLFISEDGKALICNTDRINVKESRKSQGNVGIKLNNDCKTIFSQINPSIDELLTFTLIDDKQFELRLDDIAPTNKPNEERSVYEYISGRTGNKGNLLTKKHIKSITVE